MNEPTSDQERKRREEEFVRFGEHINVSVFRIFEIIFCTLRNRYRVVLVLGLALVRA